MNERVSAGKSFRRHLWWQILLLTLVCYLAYLSSNGLNEEMDRMMPETMINCSTHNAQDSGYKAMFELCQKVGLDCQRFESSYRELDSQKAVLVVVAPTYPMMSFEIDRVLAWVAKGNNLVYLDYGMYGSGSRLLDRLGLKSSMARPIEDTVVKTAEGIAEMQHVPQLVLSSETRLSGAKAKTILADERGALMVEVKHGKGRCLVATLPSLCANRRISEKSNWGNFQFLVNWLKSGNSRILFDEKVHGYTSSQNVFVHLARGPAGLIVLQLSIIVMLALLSLNQRFGPPNLLSVKRKIASSEFIDGMALTYQKAKAYDAAFSILYGSFRTRLLKALALSPQEKVEEIARSWSQSTSLSLDETLHFLQTAEELQAQRTCNEERLLATMKECDRLYMVSKDHLSVHPGRRLGG